MTATAKAGITLVIVLVVIVLGWIWYNNSSSMKTDLSPETVTNITNPVMASAPSPKVVATTTASGMSLDGSMDSLQSDLDIINQQMSGLNTDSANIDSTLTP